MASVGGVSCDLVAHMPGVGGGTQKSEASQAPGTDGETIRLLGTAPGQFVFRAWERSTSLANAYAWRDAIEAVQVAGAPVTITDDQGKDHTNCFIADARFEGPDTVQLGGGTTAWESSMYLYGRFT